MFGRGFGCDTRPIIGDLCGGVIVGLGGQGDRELFEQGENPKAKQDGGDSQSEHAGKYLGEMIPKPGHCGPITNHYQRLFGRRVDLHLGPTVTVFRARDPNQVRLKEVLDVIIDVLEGEIVCFGEL